MKKITNKEKSLVFNALCAMSHNFYGIEVITSRGLAEKTGLDRCKVVQALNLFREDGLVKRASMGCPAQFTGGEYDEMICEAAPPVNGWSLTDAGKDTAEYKVSEMEYLNGLGELANGKE